MRVPKGRRVALDAMQQIVEEKPAFVTKR